MSLDMFRYLGTVALAIELLTSPSAAADEFITSNFTQNGGTYVVDPAGNLIISHGTNDPLLTLTNGATSAGVRDTIVGYSGGESGRLQIEAASQLFSSGDARVGRSSGTGTVTVSGSGSQWQIGGGLGVGDYQSSGTLQITDGGLVTTGGGGGVGGFLSTITVSGTGSQWNIVGGLGVGGTIEINDGGRVTSGGSSAVGVIAPSSSSTGTIIVSGAGSQWNGGALDVENGRLEITDGGLVTSGDVYLRPLNYGTNTVTVSGAGSQWSGGALSVEKSTLEITDGGLLEFWPKQGGQRQGDSLRSGISAAE